MQRPQNSNVMYIEQFMRQISPPCHVGAELKSICQFRRAHACCLLGTTSEPFLPPDQGRILLNIQNQNMIRHLSVTKTLPVHLCEYSNLRFIFKVNSYLTKETSPATASLLGFSCASTCRKNTYWNDPTNSLFNKNWFPEGQYAYPGEIKSQTMEGGIGPRVQLVPLTVSDPTVSCQVEVKLAQHRLHPLAV